MIVLFTIDCPNCKILERKLEQANIGYAVCRDKEVMREYGIDHLPVLRVDDKLMSFKEAIKWINNQGKGTM